MSKIQGQNPHTLPNTPADFPLISRLLNLYLFEAERAWASGQHSKALSQADDSTSDPIAQRAHHISRSRRSVAWSSHLVTLARSLYASQALTARGLAEIEAYGLGLKGGLDFDRERWSDGLEFLAVGRVLTGVLAETAGSSKEEALCATSMDGLDPMIRYCGYQMRIGQEVDAAIEFACGEDTDAKERLVPGYDALVKALVASAEGQTDAQNALERIVWEGQEIKVRSVELVEGMIKVQRMTQVLGEAQGKGKTGGRKEMRAFDGVLGALSDAEDIARRLIDDSQVCAFQIEQMLCVFANDIVG